MSANYTFIIDRLLREGMTGSRVLDFGCGAGDVVRLGRAAGIDMVGSDIFQVGEETRQRLVDSGELGETILEAKPGRLPFDDASFDMVCSNTVFEHVEDIDGALSEIARVLKPGGLFLNIFPTIGCLREGHCGVPFAHWLQRFPRVQIDYLSAMHGLGFGHLRGTKTRRQWARDFGDYLQRFTSYRTLKEARGAHLRYFASVERREHEYAEFRLKIEVPSRLGNALISALGFVVLGCRGHSAPSMNACNSAYRMPYRDPAATAGATKDRSPSAVSL
jgi:ubiquinone/menaquinone biosynthesis C-methylase UbiE